MHLKALEMRGFKSFPDKTRLDFENGITAIVGPNGSGKSNISDAVRWVLGEMSPKSLRGHKMEDVIFSGTAKRPQTGFCEVSLIIDNSDGALPSEYGEVKVTRKYYRSGESEYKINDKAVRLRDIYELFLNTGIGREGYSVIGQGKIAEVISQKSEERRHIFEEAAGISKYRYRKNEAEKKLSETEANLIRITDIVSEIGSRVGPLEKAAENAKKYLVLADRKKELEVSLWLKNIAKAQAESEKYRKRTDEARKNYDEMQASIEESEAKLEELYNQKQQLNLKTEEQRTLLSQLEEGKNRLSSLCALSENDILHHEERKKAIFAEKDALSSGEMVTLSEKLAEEKRKADELALSLSKEEENLSQSEKKLSACEKKLNDKQALLEALNKEKRILDEEILNTKICIAAAENAKQSEKERREFVDGEFAKANAEISEIEKSLSAARKRREQFLSEKAELTEDLKSEEKNLSDILNRHDEALRKKNELSAALSSALHRKETLEQMDRLLEGYPGSVKSVMNESSLSGICGPVSKLLSVSGEYVTAIETALGAAVSNIVVENEESAKAAIRFLQRTGAGRATFLPLTSIRGSITVDRSAEKEKGFIGIGSSLVSFDPKYQNIAEYLLGRTVVADNLDNASAIAKKYGYKFRIVTLDGQLINAGGSYTGGSAAAKSGVMSRNADIDALVRRISLLRKEESESIQKIRDSIAEKNEQINFIEGIRNDLSNIDSSLYKCEGEIDLYHERLAVCRERIEKIKGQLSEFEGGAVSEKLKSLSEKSELLKKQSEELSEKISEAEVQCDAYRDEKEELSAASTKARLRLLSAQKDLEAGRNAVTATENRIHDAEEKLLLLSEEERQISEKLSDIKNALEKSGELSEDYSRKIALQKKALEETIEKNTWLEKEMTDLRNSQRDILRDKEVYFKELTKCEALLEECGKEYDRLTAKLWEEYELTFTEAEKLNLPPPDAGFAAELSSVKAKIKALGTVNVNAVEEYREAKERYEFMTKQIEDLESSKKSLENVIKRLESDMKNMFSKAIEKINTCFNEIFVELFGGGRAQIVMADDGENILECGIEINVQPPGKMIKSLSLLSGGEQAFTAIALYFAILRVNPAPFYIFDEIEAALDDVNVNRFGAYIKKHSRETQFIVITHRRGSMEVADRLYGVTMQEKGISSFLKLDIEEVEKKTGLKL